VSITGEAEIRLVAVGKQGRSRLDVRPDEGMDMLGGVARDRLEADAPGERVEVLRPNFLGLRGLASAAITDMLGLAGTAG
jgi:hypothetical protein